MNQHTNQLEQQKDKLIDELINLGIFKMGGRQLFELSLCDLQKEYEKINSQNQTFIT